MLKKPRVAQVLVQRKTMLLLWPRSERERERNFYSTPDQPGCGHKAADTSSSQTHILVNFTLFIMFGHPWLITLPNTYANRMDRKEEGRKEGRQEGATK